MPTIRTTFEPWREIIVSDAEYFRLLRQGLIYTGETPPPRPAFNDDQYDELAASDGIAITRILDSIGGSEEIVDGVLASPGLGAALEAAVADELAPIDVRLDSAEAEINGRLSESSLSATIAGVAADEISNPETEANNAVVTIVNDALDGFSPSDTTIFHVIGDNLTAARPTTTGAVVWVTTVEGGTPSNIVTGDTVFRVTEEPLPYFTDNFTRADGTDLGTTASGGLTWLVQANVGTPNGVIASGTAGVNNTNTSGRTFATVDAGVSDGIYTATLAANDSGVQSLMFRYTDTSNNLFLNRQNSGSQVWALWKRIGGTATLIFASATTIATGQVVEVELDGTTVIVRVNGTEIINEVVTEQASATRYGFGSITTYAARWDNLSLAPLPA